MDKSDKKEKGCCRFVFLQQPFVVFYDAASRNKKILHIAEADILHHGTPKYRCVGITALFDQTTQAVAENSTVILMPHKGGQAVGFRDLNYFYKCFKDISGFTPSEFRETFCN